MTCPNSDQETYWNDQAGNTWAALQNLLDRQIGPLGALAMSALAPAPGERILDIGCGCGDTTLEIARHVAPGGAALGLDLSVPMLEVARHRAAADPAGLAQFVAGDAQTQVFDTLFDAAYSRFGVMFFADPSAAFSNIRAALRPGGRLAFVCWRQAAENPWMTVPLQAALDILPADQEPAPAPDPTAPGPFAFADAERVRDILHQAGFLMTTITPVDIPIGGFGLDQAMELALRVGPLGRLLRELPTHRTAIADAVRAALVPHATPDGIYLDSAVWIVTARNL